jgi:anti-sigma B factor antagonist
VQPLTVTARGVGDRAVVELRGELDIANSDDLRERLRAIRRSHGERLILDLSGLEFMDSHGLSVIINCYKAAVAAGGDLSLAAPRPVVRRTLEITGLHRRITVVGTVAEALTAAPGGPASVPAPAEPPTGPSGPSGSPPDPSGSPPAPEATSPSNPSGPG